MCFRGELQGYTNEYEFDIKNIYVKTMHKSLQQSSFCIFPKITVSLNFCSIRYVSI